MEKILIVRLGAMGDVIHGLPAVAAVRQRFPEAHIGWAIEERWTDLLCAQGAAAEAPVSPEKPVVNALYEMNTKGWRKALLAAQTRQELREAFRAIRDEDFDVVIDLQGSMKSALTARFSGIERRLGPAKPREFVARWFYTQEIETRRTHVIEHYAELISPLLGGYVPPSTDGRLLPLDRSAEQWRENELLSRGLAGWRYAVLSPGAGWAAKEWPAKRFGQLARELVKQGIRSLVNVGPSEAAHAEIIQEVSGGHAQALRCNISQLIALTRKASLFVGGDTGPMHLANLMGIPVVALFGPTDPARNGPYFQPSVVLRHAASSTDYSHSRSQDAGISRITVDEVMMAARRVLAKP